MFRISRDLRRAATVFTVAVLVTLVMALPASAHVSIDPSEAPKGSYGVFAFRIPNESDTASTTKLEVQFPKDNPIASVRTTSQDGWKATVVKEKPAKALENHGSKVDEVVSKITWEGGTIEPGTFAEFRISMGALPEDTDMLTFKALQTYSDGKVVSWVEETPANGEEPEFPAPTLELSKATGDDHQSSSSSDSSEETDAKAEDGDSSSNTVAYVGVGIGIVALLVGLGAIAKKK